ncbi:hypothetical protein FJU08_06805 [Martelella alba]|uniref:Uncharacterized protein n=1 Tax=Martelella alba TaxID=2590451 RepID=A0A506UEQ4_9HYPH|nr:hypothetical protein [Martelella alba]TPW31464.1 hypothetical protein FJU08_06805 [Martelella alba]
MDNEHGLSPEELAMLTPAERAGLEADDGDIGDEDIGGADEGQPEDKAKAKPEPEADPEAEPKKEPAKEPAKGKIAGEDKEPGHEATPDKAKAAPPEVPLFKSDVPKDISDRLKALDAKEDALVDRFEDGDLTTREYNAELRKVNKERSTLEWQVHKAELSEESTQSQREQAWYNTANGFLEQHPEIAANETRYASFDAVLRKVTSEVIANGGWPGQAEIEKAYQQWAADLGIKAEPAPNPAPAPKNPAPKQPDIPPSLAKVPAAGLEQTDDGKYAALDRLSESDPLAYEEEIAKMNEAEFEAYANSR